MNRITQEAKKRQGVVKLANRKGKSFAGRVYGVSLSSVKRWCKRYDGSWQSLAERSHRPLSHPKRHSAAEALIEMYLAGVSVRRVEDVTEALWGSKVSPATISELNKKAYVHIEDWRNRPLQGGKYPYVYVDGIYLRRNWGGEYENVAILVAIAVNEDGYREVLGAAEGMKEDKASWVNFFQCLKSRGLDGVKLIVGGQVPGNAGSRGRSVP